MRIRTPTWLAGWVLLVSNLVLASEPEITTTVVKLLHEYEESRTVITTATCTDADGDEVVVSGTITPTSRCNYCFIVEPTDVDGGEYEIVFYPTVADLQYLSVQEYDVLLDCNDGNSSKTKNVEIRLYPNSYPIFTNGLLDGQTVSNTKTTVLGDTVFTVAATDEDDDPIFFTLTSTTPASDNFGIGYTSGEVYAKTNLDEVCVTDNTMTFDVSITDGKHTPTSQTITVDLNNANKRPIITNNDEAAEWAETTAVNTPLVTVNVDDDDTTTLDFTTIPTNAFGLFEITGSQIFLKDSLDYEAVNLRAPRILVTASDGACTSTITYTYTVSVTDVNEAPTILPEDKTYYVYENDGDGTLFTVDPQWDSTDPESDKLTYTITGSTPTISSTSHIQIDPDTGIITSKIVYDVDNGAMTATVTLTVQVADPDGLTDTTTVVLHIKDANDNRPKFTTNDLFLSATTCSQTGVEIGTFAATDDDSDFEDNNVLEFAGGADNDVLKVTGDGSVILNSLLAAGASRTFDVTLTDHGVHPNGPLTSLVPGSVTISFTDCPPTTTPAPVTTSSSTTTTTTTTTTTPAPDGFSDSENLWWIILGALLGVAFLGLTLWLCMTRALPFCSRGVPASHWSRCGGGSRGMCGGDMCRQKRPPRGHNPRKINVQKQQQQQGKPPENGDPDFWKKDFADGKSKNLPDDDGMPAPANYDKDGAPLRPGNTPKAIENSPRMMPALEYEPLHGPPGREPIHGPPGREPIHGPPGREPIHGAPGREPIHGAPGRNPAMISDGIL